MIRVPADERVQMSYINITAIVLQDTVGSKVGLSGKFTEIYVSTRQNLLIVQRKKKISRTLQYTTNPAGAAKRETHS